MIINFLYQIFSYLVAYMLDKFYPFFKVIPLYGRADDLLAIQLTFLGSLFIILVAVFLLFLIYLLSNILKRYHYQILARYNNKWINFILKLFINRLTSIYLPILILIGIVASIYLSHSLITHPIPFWEAGIDLTNIFFTK